MASRKEQKEALRRERLAREEAAAASTRRRRLIGVAAGGGLAAAALAAVVVVIAAGGGDGGGGEGGGGSFPKGSVPEVKLTDLEAAAEAAGCVLKDPPNEGQGHTTEPVAYKSNPPTSGSHDPVPADDGARTEAPRTEALVHSLEHSRIVVQFKPSLPDGARGDLKALFDEDPLHMILTPNETEMPYEVAATAWDHLVGCKRMNAKVFDALRAFKDRYRDKGPEVPP